VDARYCFVFVVLAALSGVAAVVGWGSFGWVTLLLGYASLSFLLLAMAYGGAGAVLLGKRGDGRRSAWAWVMLAPYFLLNAVTFRLYRLFSREPAFAEVAPNLFFGRRLGAREARRAEGHGWVAVLDLAAEFPEVGPLRRLPGYRSLPVLGATAPAEEQFREAVAWLVGVVASGPVYVHCALGHGRTACVVVAYLLSAGLVTSAAEGLRLLRASRPGVRLHRSQRQLVRKYEPAGDAQGGRGGS
jgi:hypothetical protein